MRQVLVTGAAGFLGVHLITELRRCDMGVVAVDDGSAGTWERLSAFADDPGVECHEVDIRDPRSLARVWPRGGVWAVAHLAARHFIPDCEAHPQATWHVNVDGTRNVLARAQERPPTRFLLASTADVYAVGAGPHREADQTAPPTVYGRSKQAAEELVRQAASTQPGTGFLRARLFNLYGPGHTVDHLIPTVMEQALASDKVELGNLDSARDYVFVRDAARALVELLTGTVTGVINIGTGIATTGHAIVTLTEQLLGRRLTVVPDSSRMRPSDRPRLVAAPDRLTTLLPWWPATPLEDGLALTLAARERGTPSAFELQAAPQ